IDKLTYAGNLESLAPVAQMPGFTFEQVDICDGQTLSALFEMHRPSAVLHLAAESHVDRSIDRPTAFVHTNVLGTFTLLDAARTYLATAPDGVAERFRFIHVSTDEVFGSLDDNGRFDENTA